MQMGTRWSVGADAPAQLSDDVRAAVASVEAELADIDTSQWRWTLTWLEGRPVAELDDGTTIRVDAYGVVTVEAPTDD
jgi:hypothetical protein